MQDHKGQIISECLFEKIVSTKIPTKNLIDSAQKSLYRQGKYLCWTESGTAKNYVFQSEWRGGGADCAPHICKAVTFFANFMTILIALQDKSVSFHFANFLDLDELDYFEFISVVCRHRLAPSIYTHGADGLMKLYFLNSPNNKLIFFFSESLKNYVIHY